MGPILYSLLTISGFSSIALCRPLETPAQQLQSQQPLLPGLPSNDGMTLQYVALGVGTQNYTCNGANFVQGETGDGAFATLYDATLYLSTHTSDIPTLPATRLSQYEQDGEWQNLADLNLPILTVLGNHYFDFDDRPTFNLSHAFPTRVLSAVKADDVKSPTVGAIDWLYLIDNGDGITNGLKAVYRVETAGGVAPTSCDSVSTETTIPYAAEYWFYD